MRLGTVLSIVSLLTIVIASDLTQVFAKPAIASCIDIGSRSLRILSPLVTMLLLFFSPELLIGGIANLLKSRKGLVRVGKLISRDSGSKKFFRPRVLHQGQILCRRPGLRFFDSRVFH